MDTLLHRCLVRIIRTVFKHFAILVLRTHPTTDDLVHLTALQSVMENRNVFFLSLNLLIGWQLSIWICCKPFFSLLYNCQLLCFWRLALSIVVEVFPRPFFGICFFMDVYYKLVMLNCMPYPRVALFSLKNF